MATHNIFIEHEVREQKLGISSYYTYEDGFLRIYNKGRRVYFLEVNKGDAFVVICERGKVILKSMAPPKRNGALIGWLLRFNRDNRASSIEEYKRKLYGQRKRREWEGYKEKEFVSYSYMFTLCNSPIDTNYRNVVGFFSDAITKNEVLALIPLMQHHPEWYIKKILWENFNISEIEFDTAKKKPL